MPERLRHRINNIEVHQANKEEESVKDDDAETDPEFRIVKDIAPVRYHYLVECIYAENDQDSGIEYPEDKIGNKEISKYQCDIDPGGNACRKDRNKHRSVAIEEAPVMEHPAKETEIEKGKRICYDGKSPRIIGHKKDPCSDLNDQYKEYAIKKGIVRSVNFIKPYYPDQYCKHNAQAQNKTNCIIHQLRWRGL